MLLKGEDMSKITATFDQRTTRDGYAVGVTISDFDATDPASFEPCLLVNTAGAGNIVRAATLLDLYNYSGTGLKLDFLSCSGLFEPLEAGDVFHFTYIPEIWADEEGAETLDVTVSDASHSGVGSVQIDTSLLKYGEFACGFEGLLEFSVTRGSSTMISSSANTITVGRYQVGGDYPTVNRVMQNYYRVKRSITLFSNVTEAANKVVSLKAELQNLINDANTVGIEYVNASVEEVFE
jgi:hypothetical protein